MVRYTDVVDALTLSREVLDWAAHRAGESLETLAALVAKRDTDRERIVRGELTVGQAEKIAKRARIPFGTLFLDKPPKAPALEIPDLRQTANPLPLGDDFRDTYADVLARQQWYIERQRRQGAERVPFVGRFAYAKAPKATTLAENIRSTLGLTDFDRARSRNPAAYFATIAEKAERSGVLVMKSGIVRSNTRRALSEKEFRGFALADKLAPVVFINGRDAEVATVFTLAHELAHIWLGESGVSDVFSREARGLERLCNQVAANLLVPRDAFLAVWKEQRDVVAAAAHFRVSRFVAGYRALDLELIDQSELKTILDKKYPAKKPGGANALYVIPVRNSKRFTRTIVASAMRGDTMIRDAASLLNVRPDTITALDKSSREAQKASRRG